LEKPPHPPRPPVRLLPINDDVLADLLAVAIADADPAEVMPPVPGPPGWTPTRREAFIAFHRDRREGLAGRLREATFAISVDGQVVGSARLQRKDRPAVLETGLSRARMAATRSGVERT
jgi:RimJ/RimL family protein N-acetyltransferase